MRRIAGVWTPRYGMADFIYACIPGALPASACAASSRLIALMRASSAWFISCPHAADPRRHGRRRSTSRLPKHTTDQVQPAGRLPLVEVSGVVGGPERTLAAANLDLVDRGVVHHERRAVGVAHPKHGLTEHADHAAMGEHRDRLLPVVSL